MLLGISLMMGCGYAKDKEKTRTSVDSDSHVKMDDDKIEATFTGTIEKINGHMALVTVKEGKILKSYHEVDVDLSVAEDTNFKVGDQVNVGYVESEVRETAPLGINTTFVELMKEK